MNKTEKQTDTDEAKIADWADQVSTNPHWDQDVADDLIGAIVLVGITDAGLGEDAVEQLEMWGMVESADPEEGIEIELHGELAGETFVCPPEPGCLCAGPSRGSIRSIQRARRSPIRTIPPAGPRFLQDRTTGNAKSLINAVQNGCFGFSMPNTRDQNFLININYLKIFSAC